MDLSANCIGAADLQQLSVRSIEFVDGAVPLVCQPALYTLCEVVLSGRLASDMAFTSAAPEEQMQAQANVRSLQLAFYSFLCGALDRFHAVLPQYTRLIVTTICTNIEVTYILGKSFNAISECDADYQQRT